MSLGSLCQETPVGSPKPQRTGGRVTAPAGASQEAVGLWDSFPHSRASPAEPGGKACVSPGAGSGSGSVLQAAARRGGRAPCAEHLRFPERWAGAMCLGEGEKEARFVRLLMLLSLSFEYVFFCVHIT